VVPVVMMMPAHFRRQLLFGILLHHRRSARVDQRHSLCTLEWSRDHKQRADSRKTHRFKTPGSYTLHSSSSSQAISRQRHAAVLLPATARRNADGILGKVT
jgi:hypothetical protein